MRERVIMHIIIWEKYKIMRKSDMRGCDEQIRREERDGLIVLSLIH